MINFTTFRGGLFAKYKVQELNNGEFYARKRTFLFFYNYIDKEGFTWHDLYYASIYGRCSTVDGAKDIIDRWIRREKNKKEDTLKKKTKRFIKYP